MGRRFVGEGDSGVINFVGFSIGRRLGMAWSLFLNGYVYLPNHFEVATSLPEPASAKPEAPPK